MNNTKLKKKAFIDTNYCVACGACKKECPLRAIHIYKGIYAEVDYEKCIGCSKCSRVCPTSTIEIRKEEA